MRELDDILGTKCQHCGQELSIIYKQVLSWGFKYPDDAFDEGYCNKLCRKAHEKQLIQEGKMEGIPLSGNFAIMKDTKYRDSKGEMIWFPKDERPYFDRACQRVFHSKKEKHEYLKKNNLVMDGSSDKGNRPIEAGDYRKEKVR